MGGVEDGNGNSVPVAYHATTLGTPLFIEGDSRSYTYSYQYAKAFRWDDFVRVRFRIRIATSSGSTNNAMLLRFTGLWNIDTSRNDADNIWLELTRLENIANYGSGDVGAMYVMFTHTDTRTVRLGPAGEGSLGDGSILEGTFCYHTNQ